MDKGGFFLVYRGVFPDFGSAPYTEREAWLWLIASAGYENGDVGQFRTSLSDLAKAWNWKYQKRYAANKVARFLDKLLKQERISFWNNNPVSSEQSWNKLGTSRICITICNYAKYQKRESCLGTNLEQSWNNQKLVWNNPSIFEYLKQKKENKEIKKKRKVPKEKPTTCEQVQARIDKIDLAPFRDKYGFSLVDSVFQEFSETCLEGTAKKPRPNPYDYVDFSKALTTWIKKRINDPQSQCSPETESFADQVKRESQKLKELNERFMK